MAPDSYSLRGYEKLLFLLTLSQWSPGASYCSSEFSLFQSETRLTRPHLTLPSVPPRHFPTFQKHTNMKTTKRGGFSLIEMVIVILILGIIAAVAAPKMFDTAKTAEQNSTRQQLAVLRNAIEMARIRNGVYPPADQLPTILEPMLNGPFPKPNMGTVRNKAGVYYDPTTTVDVPVVPSPSETTGWAYKPSNGSLKLNVAAGELGADW